MGAAWSIEHEDRRIEVAPVDTWSGYRVTLTVDGERVGEARSKHARLSVAGGGVEVEAKLAWHGLRIQEARLVEGPPLEPAPGTMAARQAALARERPGLYAARHAVAGVGKVLIPLLGLGALLRFLPLPELNLNLDLDLDVDLPLPEIPWPAVDLPEVPGWIRAIGEAAKYWGPILAGVVVAVNEYRRRRRRQPER